MTDFNLETACREAQNRLHRSIGQRARWAKYYAWQNVQIAFMDLLLWDWKIQHLEHEIEQGK